MTNEYRAKAFLRRVIITMSVRIDSRFLFEVSNSLSLSLSLNSRNSRERKAPQEKSVPADIPMTHMLISQSLYKNATGRQKPPTKSLSGYSKPHPRRHYKIVPPPVP